MNEIRDLIIGIDIGKEYTQICYYDRKAEEARSLSMKVGASQYEAPGCICYRTDHGDYCVGLEAEYFAREKGGIMIGNIYDICQLSLIHICPVLRTSVLPLGDGAAVSVKTGEQVYETTRTIGSGEQP